MPPVEPPHHAPVLRVFMHGFTGTPSAWDTVRAHLSDAPGLAMCLPGHHPDLPLHAITPDPRAPGAFADVVKALSASLAHSMAAYPGRRVHLIGYSLGARLALGMLLHNPERLACVTLLGCHPGLQQAADRSARAAGDAAWENMLRQVSLPAFMERWLAQPMFTGLNTRAPEATAWDVTARMQHQPEHLADALAAMSLARMPNFWPALSDVSVPVCYAAGAKDKKFVALAQAAHQATPRSMHHLIPGAGHNVLIEAPGAVATCLTSLEARLGPP